MCRIFFKCLIINKFSLKKVPTKRPFYNMVLSEKKNMYQAMKSLNIMNMFYEHPKTDNCNLTQKIKKKNYYNIFY